MRSRGRRQVSILVLQETLEESQDSGCGSGNDTQVRAGAKDDDTQEKHKISV